MQTLYSSSKAATIFFISYLLGYSSAASAENAEDSTSLEVISITATKTAKTINQTPDSISTVLAEEIAQIAPQHINQVLDGTPGVWISRGNGQEHLTAIRSPVLTGAGSCGSFFMGLDGISIRAPGFCNANQLFDINYEQAARIDVLRSPSSTLYGGNALHGLINVISPNAFDESINKLGLQLGSYDYIRLSNSYGQINEDSAWINLVNVTQENGFQSESGYDQQKITHIYQTRGSLWDTKTVIDLSNLNQETAGFIRGFESYADKQIRRINPNPEAYRDVSSIRAYTTLTKTDDNSLLSLTPYIRWNTMKFLQHFLPWQALEENSHASMGIQTQYSFQWQGIDWVSGFDVDLTRASLRETQEDDFSPSIPQGLHYDYKVDASQLAAYTQGTWQYKNWVIRAGARAERNAYDYNNLTNGQSACAEEVSLCRFSRPDDQSVSFNAISPSVNIQYLLKDNVSVYTKYSQGFRAPQATELFRLQNNQQLTNIDNENMDSIEAGLRYNNDNTNVHVSVYSMQKEDVIFQNSDRQNVNGGKTDHKGVELELRHFINSQWQLNGHVSWSEHTYKNDTSLVSTNIINNQIDTAPQWMSNINLTYAPSNELSAQLSWQYLSEYYLNPENTAKYDGHQLVDVNIRYQVSEKVSLGLHMLNLMDEDYAERADFAFGAYRYFVGQPRRAFINLVWSY